MSQYCVKTHRLSKSFSAVTSRRTVFRALKAVLKGDSLARKFCALRDVTFAIAKGENLAMIGQNGAGKTTLLRILAGIYEPTSGSFERNGTVKALFGSWFGLNSELPVIDNIYLFGAVHGMNRDFLRDRTDRILELAELFPFRFSAFKTLSTGQQQRLALSVFFQTVGDINIFDESLSPLDQGFVGQCERYFETLAQLQKSVILTSHNLALLRRFCRKALWLDHGAVRMWGNTEDVLDAYETALTHKEPAPAI